MRSRLAAGLIVGFVLLAATACGGGTSDSQQPGGATTPPGGLASIAVTGTAAAAECTTGDTGSEHVTFGNGTFNPAQITVPAGTTITWVNDERVPHQIIFKSGPSCGITDPHSATSITFDTPGTFDYYCRFHTSANEKGTVTVQ